MIYKYDRQIKDVKNTIKLHKYIEIIEALKGVLEVNILFINPKDINIYKERQISNLTALLEDRHNIEVMEISKNILKRLENKKPDILYLSIGGQDYLSITNLFKDKGVTTVADIDTLKNFVDVFINSEPEQVLPMIVKAMEEGKGFSEVRGITFKQTTKKAEKWDIDKLPFTLKNKGNLIFSNMGCKGQCSFCIMPKQQGKLRFRSIANTIEEVKKLTTIEGFNQTYRYSDCSFDSNPPKRLKALLKALIREVPHTVYGANFRPDFHKMADKELIDLLFYSGNHTAFIGVESANEYDLRLYNKKTTVEDSQNTIKLFVDNDTAVNIGFIMFNPFSTFNGIRENIAFLRKHHLATYYNLTKKLIVGETPIKKTIQEAGLLLANGYSFIFQEDKVTTLTETIKLVETELHHNAFAIYRNFNIDEIKRLKRVAFLLQKEPEFIAIQGYELQALRIIHQESDRLTEWVIKLMDMIEAGTPAEEYFIMSREYINTAHIREVITNLKNIDRLLHIAMQKTTTE